MWIIFLIFFTPITRPPGARSAKGMAHRSEEARKQMQEAQQANIRETAGRRRTCQITQARHYFDLPSTSRVRR